MYTCKYGHKTIYVIFGNLMALRFDALPFLYVYKLLIFEVIIICLDSLYYYMSVFLFKSPSHHCSQTTGTPEISKVKFQVNKTLFLFFFWQMHDRNVCTELCS